MKQTKKILFAILGVLLLAVVIVVIFVGTRVAPTVEHAMRISELLQPMIEAKNQSTHIHMDAQVNDHNILLDGDVYMVTEEDVRYLAMEQSGVSLYLCDNLLLLENGKAFQLGENMQQQTISYSQLLPQIVALYNVLNITTQEIENGTIYEITVTGQQVESLLAATSLGVSIPVDAIQSLQLCLTEKNDTMEEIRFTGQGALDNSTIQLDVTLSDFHVLASGDYPIPDVVKQTVATVDPDTLFSLTEDLYRLLLALAPFADADSLDGTLALYVECSLIQFDTEIRLSDLNTSSISQIDPQQLQALPQMLGWLCMEGDIHCTKQDAAYVYTLELDTADMEQLAQMILPELSEHGNSLTKGSVTILLENEAITSMEVAIEGKISVLITKVPITIQAVFTFDPVQSNLY